MLGALKSEFAAVLQPCVQEVRWAMIEAMNLLREAYDESEAESHHLLGEDWGNRARRLLDPVVAESRAAEIIEKLILPNGNLGCDAPWLHWRRGEVALGVDGGQLTPDELEAIAWWIRHMNSCATTNTTTSPPTPTSGDQRSDT